MSKNRDDKFIWDAGDFVTSQCLYCKHYSRLGGPGGNVCGAYPGQIPDEVFANYWDHRHPKGDEEDFIVFDPLPTVSAAVLAALGSVLDDRPPNI